MSFLRSALTCVVLLVLAYLGLSALRQHLDPHTSQKAEDNENSLWIASSNSWFDRQTCRWIGLCGLAHWRPDPAGRSWRRKRLARASVRPGRENIEDNTKVGEEDKIRENPSSCHNKKQVKTSSRDDDVHVLKEVPQYVIDYAPLIHLYSGEHFWPSNITEHLMHTTPYLDHSTFNLSNHQYTPYNLEKLNQGCDSDHVFLHSRDDVEERPKWLGSLYNIPTSYNDDSYINGSNINNDQIDEGKSGNFEDNDESSHRTSDVNESGDNFSNATRKIDLRRSQIYTSSSLTSSTPRYPSGYSRAPSILVIVDKGSGVVDAFWFYFYSYNLGTTVFNIRFGNHVGDWEHSLIRFQDGVPQSVFLSAHSGGLAYDWKAIEKGRGERPVFYSAFGSHAMYATPGKHPYILPFGLLADITDKGPLWDLSLNFLAYHFDTPITHDIDARLKSDGIFSNSSRQKSPSHIGGTQDSFRPATCNPTAPTGWWWYDGRWGDKFYELRDWRQWRFAGQYHYVNGPFGPRFKNLGRANVCQSGSTCEIVKDISKGMSWIRRYL
ncbi:putative vacuolar protein sorting-associated protein TDA6 [Golovinomyces cichoracearum]|uniref:Putative vacuolar protein sorting-associated protein TDA6 n=1 Tax=Golovinomyces cichoracearum TaxID=62708 RepID=A0A420IS30_9PEZI|nr:putative vacuolar protein sorting-associated protein TDA6 [Golovinomyces cichoracearum]